MRLIDVDTSMESIKKLIDNGHTVEQALDAQPTAYDVDKVVEQLEDYLFEYCTEGDVIIDEIVRKGGVE